MRITRTEFTKIVMDAFRLKPNAGKVFKNTKGHWAKLPKVTLSNPERRFKEKLLPSLHCDFYNFLEGLTEVQ